MLFFFFKNIFNSDENVRIFSVYFYVIENVCVKCTLNFLKNAPRLIAHLIAV